MDDDEMEPLEFAVPARGDEQYDPLLKGIVSWAGFLFAACLGRGSDAFIVIVVIFFISVFCGIHALTTAPLRSSARIHAMAGVTLWLASIVIIVLLRILDDFHII